MTVTLTHVFWALVGVLGVLIGGLIYIALRLRVLDEERAIEEKSRLEGQKAMAEYVRAQRGELQASLERTDRRLSQDMANLKMSMDAQQSRIGTQMTQLIRQQADASEALGAKIEAKLKDIRDTEDAKLSEMRESSEKRLEEIRGVVQEKLDRTLAERLKSGFQTVDEKLGLVQSGLGEMRQMAASVRDLKGVLTNVKTRGNFGETQLSVILADILAPSQYGEQVRVVPGRRDAVDFAVKMPGAGGECWLPIDSKFPLEDYERLLAAQSAGDAEAAKKARGEFEKALLRQAQSIHEKYVCPPHTTEFAIMYLPSEGLYAEALRSPGLLDRLRREYRITPAGPTVISALINSLQLGFVTLALQERSAEVWRVLGEVKGEFLRFAAGFETVERKFREAQSSLDAMKTRQNVMSAKMAAIGEEGLFDAPKDKNAAALADPKSDIN